jgi:membrane peptidoglycan carboxypeptidase
VLDIRNRFQAAVIGHRTLFIAGAFVIYLCGWTGVGASFWYLHAAAEGLPDAAAVSGAGSMARATTIADGSGRHAFTIFQEQRLQVPLARVSPNLVQAMIAIEDRRFYNHRGIDPIRIAGAAVNDLMKYDHPAARAPHPADSGKDHPPQTAGSRTRHALRAHVHEGRDPRAVPEQGVFR